MKKASNYLYQDKQENKEGNKNSSFSPNSIDIPDELIAISQRNPFRESKDAQTDNQTKAVTVLVLVVKAALVLSAKATPFPPRVSKQ